MGVMSRRLGDALVRCLREVTAPVPAPVPLADLVPPGRMAALVPAADHHGIAPAVYHAAARPSGLPAAVDADLEEAYRRQWQLHLRALGDLAELVPLLDGVGPAWAVVKGPVLAETVYRRMDVRSYVDLDVLVHRSTLPAALEALEGAGATLVDRNWTLIRAGVRGEITLQLRHGTTLDLHWHLFNEPHLRRAFAVPMEAMLGRTRRVEVHGIATPTLDGPDTLVHLAAHAGLAGGHRLVWLKDIEQVVAHQAPDWDRVVARSRAAGLALVVATMLARARRTVGAPVPVAVLDALAPAVGWRALVGLAGRVSPPQRSFSHRLTGRTLVASTRRSDAASAAALARAAWSEALRPLLSDRRHPWRGGGDPPPRPPGAAANPLHDPAGDHDDRESFLRLVSRAVTEP